MTKFAFIFLFAAGLAKAQVPASLQADLKKLYVAFDDIDLEGLSQMLCTGDPATLYGKLDAYFQNDENKFRYVMHAITYQFGKAVEADGKVFYPVSYRNIVRITYFHTVDVQEKQQTLKTQFGAESVSYDKSRNAFLVVYRARLVAFPDGGNWKYAFTDMTLPKDISAGCLPESLKNSLAF